jgi:hypothetical protein
MARDDVVVSQERLYKTQTMSDLDRDWLPRKRTEEFIAQPTDRS